MTPNRADSDFFESRKWLRYVKQYADAAWLAQWGLVATILARFSGLIPPNIVGKMAPSMVDLSLNLNVALVGTTGSGKSLSMKIARKLLPTPFGNPLKEINPKTGEAIASYFIDTQPKIGENGKPVKGEYEYKVLTDRLFAYVPEITGLGASMNRQGSSMISKLLAAFSGEDIGDSTKGKEFRIALPEDVYRYSSVIGMQPAKSNIIFNETSAGLTARFLYLPVNDSDAEFSDTPLPETPFPYNTAELPKGNGLEAMQAAIEAGSLNSLMQRVNTATGVRNPYPLRRITFPASVKKEVLQARQNGVRGLIAEEDSHQIELYGRTAALLALLENRYEVNEEDCQLAKVILAKSRETRKMCEETVRAKRVERKTQALTDMDEAQERLEDTHRERAENSILKQLHKGFDCTENELKRAVRSNYRNQFDAAFNGLLDDGQIRKLDNGRYTLA
ncbi:hypothetical protein [Bifidobacterium magnum]|uniref:Putative phage primase/polymerase gp20 n=1 Tax=Bifidobacterium magnum TaxID=1692 RepID=A0A087BB59_9BIFI|nr:hypothetical protein [Bifidobacterium magnum]KFI68259.1 putative phage primase/polymerase gp20 [Bifidobacterium magnum]